MYLLLLVYTWIIGGNAKSFTLKYAWSMGYDAECIVPITENVYGWTLHLKFDQPIYYVESFSGKLVYHTDTEWVLENRPEFAYLTPGQDTKIQFLVRHRDILQPILGSCTFKTHGWNVPLWLPSNELSDRWSSGDTVTKSIHIHTDTAINNWVVCLLFDYPVDYVTVPGGEVLAHLEREWIIRNNDVVYPGQGMDKDLVIHPSGNFPVSGKYFLEKDGCPSIGENPPARLPGPKNQWNGGYETWINIEFQQPVIKWRIRFTFDKRINEVWTDKATLVHNFHDQFEWIIESKPEVSHLNPGQKLPLQVIVKYYGTDVIGALYTVIPATEETSITMKYDYTRALELSTLFYSAQRSGRLPANNHDISWRSDSAIQDGDRNHDLSGGWYNDGGHVKANLPMAFSTWVLEWGMLKFHEGYKSTGHVNNGCDMIRWSLEYLLKSWVPERNVLYVQVGDKARDNAYWMSPEVMTMERPAFSVNASCPGSDVAANMVSAFAAGKLLFNGLCNDNVFGDTLIQAADSLYRFAKNYRGVYSNCIKQGPHYYRSKDDSDYLSVAAMWMYRATTRINYLQDSKTFLTLDKPDVFSWDDTNIAAALLLYEATHDYTYRTYITTYMMRYFTRSSVHYTTCGLAWSAKPGSNGIAANAAFIATMAAELGLYHQKYTQFAMSQIHYLLGENKLQQSYLIAYGNKYPRNPHHRGSSCSRHKASCSYMEPGPNVNILYGALVSGPDIHDNYTDRRTNYKQNSVALEYNAGFQSTMAGLLTFHHRSTLPISPIPKC